MKIAKEQLKRLIVAKLHKAGLLEEHAETVADVLVHADLRGVHSHGAMRVEYYAERISKGGITTRPRFNFTRTGPCSGVFDGDNGVGHVIAERGMREALKIAAENGVAVVGMRRMAHSGALSYYVQQAARAGYIGVSMCQSDPMAVPYGGAEPFYGTNPIAFCTPGADGRMITADLAVTVQAWGKILHARSRKESIPDSWAVGPDGRPTTDPFNIGGLVHIAGAKGYALALMVDVLSGVLLGLPYGNKVTSMYADLSEPRNLGQIHLVLDPGFFTDKHAFLKTVNQVMDDLNHVRPAPGFAEVLYPGQGSAAREQEQERNGIEIVDDVYTYLISGAVHHNTYDGRSTFAV